jgi:hypothetical protein
MVITPCIRQVPSLNIDPETAYAVRVFRGFLQSSKQVAGYYLKLGHDRFLTYPFHLSHCVVIYSVVNYKIL